MKKIIVKDYEILSNRIANLVLSTMFQDKRVNLSLTGGRTPKRMYEILVEMMADLEDLSNVFYYTFDETPIRNQMNKVIGYDNLDGLNHCFFEPLSIGKKHIIAMSDDNYLDFPRILANDGGIDLMVIGMGEDGHFCANMPECTQYDKEVYSVELNNKYPWNAPYQESLGKNHSDYMYTLGFPSLLKVAHVVLIVNGVEKAVAVKRAFEGPLDSSFPSSYLRLLPNLTVILDEEAAKLLRQ